MIFVRELSVSSDKWFGYGGYYMIAGKGCQPHDLWNSLSCPLIIRNTLTRSDEGVSNYEFSPGRELVSEVRRACLSLPTGSVTRHPTRVVHPASGVWPPTAATVPAKELTFVCDFSFFVRKCPMFPGPAALPTPGSQRFLAAQPTAPRERRNFCPPLLALFVSRTRCFHSRLRPPR